MSAQGVTRFWLAVAGSVVSLLLSWPYWRDFGYWATSPALWRLYFIAGFCLAVFVFVVFLRSLATLSEHDRIARVKHQKRGPAPPDSNGGPGHELQLQDKTVAAEAGVSTIEAYLAKYPAAAERIERRGGGATLMPNLMFQPVEADALVAFLKYTSEMNTEGWPPVPAMDGLGFPEARPMLAAAYYMIPLMRGRTGFDQRAGKLSFWLVFTGMLGMAFAFAIGGTIQVFAYRTLGLDWFGGDVRPAMQLTKVGVAVFGVLFAVRLLSFNLDAVREGSAVLPYTMAVIGYPGLLLVTLLFVWRFLASLEAQVPVAEAHAMAAVPAE